MTDQYLQINDIVWTRHGYYFYSPFPGKEITLVQWPKNIGNLTFARHSYDFDVEDITEWWYIVKDGKERLKDYSSNHRNQIRKGLKNFDCVFLEDNTIMNLGYPIYSESLKEYGLKPLSQEDYIKRFKQDLELDLEIEYYGLFRDGELVGYAKNLVNPISSYVFYENIYITSTYKKLYPNYCLIHTMNLEYLNKRSYQYVSDGSRTLLHPTGIQNFLIKKFLFRKAYCRIQVKYGGIIGPIIKVLSYLDGILKGRISRIKPEIRALILQHTIYETSKLRGE